jgi:outer membrane biosynthesis protein TonB
VDRAEATGFGVALAGHGALLAILSLGLASVRQPPLMNEPMEVSIVDEVGLQSAVTEIATEAPAQSVAPELGPPEEPAPVEEPAPPEPTPPPPRPEPVPPPPQPRPVPKTVIPPPPKPTPKPVPKAAAAKPAPAKPQPKPAPAKTPPKPALAKASPARPAPARPAPSQSSGKGQAQAARGSRLGPGFLKGIGSDPSPSTSTKPTGAVMSSQAVANIGSAILRQVQPCANRQVQPGPGAERIRVNVNLRLNPDGSLAARPRVTGRTGVDDENRRYADRVDDLAIATFVGCAPLKGLPAELYNVRNGWSNFTLRYKLPG